MLLFKVTVYVDVRACKSNETQALLWKVKWEIWWTCRTFCFVRRTQKREAFTPLSANSTAHWNLNSVPYCAQLTFLWCSEGTDLLWPRLLYPPPPTLSNVPGKGCPLAMCHSIRILARSKERNALEQGITKAWNEKNINY